MRALTVEQRGDLAEAMLPVAAHMAALVHGDGGVEDVQDVLDPLSEQQRTALIVVLAGLVDPDRTMGQLLGWLDRDEHGRLTVPAWEDKTRCRDLASDDEDDTDAGDVVDPVAVRLYLQGIPGVTVTDAEFLSVLEHAEAQGLTMNELDRRRGVGRKSHEDRVNRMRKRYQRAGLALPPGLETGKGQSQPEFTDAEVIQIRERAAAGGITDRELAVQYGRTRQAIGRLLSGVSYRNVGGPIRVPRGPKPGATSRAEFNGHTGPAPADMAQAS